LNHERRRWRVDEDQGAGEGVWDCRRGRGGGRWLRGASYRKFIGIPFFIIIVVIIRGF
jgi:hypothetical protein